MNRRLCLIFIALVAGGTHVGFADTFTVGSRAEADSLRRRIKAIRFLDCATFGATRSDTDALVQRMVEVGDKKAMAEWIDQQFAVEPTYLEPTAISMIADDGLDWVQPNAGVQRYRHQAFWHVALTAPDQLRQRVAFALSQICVINSRMFNSRETDLSGKPIYLAPLNYYDALIRNASNSYRSVLVDVTRHPCMGRFLSHLRNRMADEVTNRFPDENYAREIMQLFSIGLYELRPNGTYELLQGEPIPTYSNEAIREFSRVFTGFTDVPDAFYGEGNYFAPMAMWEAEHDTGQKTLLNDVVLPAGQSGLQDMNDAIDNLIAHKNVAPFIGRRLIQRLTKSNPGRGYMARVSRVFSTSGGNLTDVAKAILLDREFQSAVSFKTVKTGPGVWTLRVRDNGSRDSRFQEPMIRYAAFLRKFDCSTQNPNGWFMMSDMTWHWTQGFLESPSVFNFYSPDFQPPGDVVRYRAPARIPNRLLAAPEFEIYTAVTANRTPNRYRADIYHEESRHKLFKNADYHFTNDLALDFGAEIALAENPQDLVDHLDVLFAHGNLSREFRETLVAALTEETTNATERAKAAILSVLNAPQTAVTR